MNINLSKNKIKLWVILTLTIILLSGCTKVIIKAAYNNADWIVKNEFDKYLDLSWAQDDILGDSLKVFLNNHRSTELPITAEFLEDLKQKVKNSPTKPITLKEVYDTTNRFVNVRNRLILSLFNEEMNAFLKTLTIEQVNYFAKTMKERLTVKPGNDGKTVFQRTADENQAYFLEMRKKDMVTWFGEVTPEQVQMLEKFPLIDLENRRLFYTERDRVLDLLIARMKKQVLIDRDAELTRTLLRTWFTDLRALFSEEYIASTDARAARIQQFSIDLDRSLTPKQREFFIEQMEYYQQIIRELNRNI